MPLDYIREHYRTVRKIKKDAMAGFDGPNQLAGGMGPTKAKLPGEIQKKHKWIPPRGTVLGEGWK